jgi:hypothetical protein
LTSLETETFPSLVAATDRPVVGAGPPIRRKVDEWTGKSDG